MQRGNEERRGRTCPHPKVSQAWEPAGCPESYNFVRSLLARVPSGSSLAKWGPARRSDRNPGRLRRTNATEFAKLNGRQTLDRGVPGVRFAKGQRRAYRGLTGLNLPRESPTLAC